MRDANNSQSQENLLTLTVISAAITILLSFSGTFSSAEADTWMNTYGGPGDDRGFAAQQTSDGGYIVSGATSSFDAAGGGDFWLLKLNPDGSVAWEKMYGTASFENEEDFALVQQTSDGGYIVAGRTGSIGADDTDFWALKLDSDGNVEWEKRYGTPFLDFLRSAQETSDGGYLLAGESGSFVDDDIDFDAWLLKLDSDGNIEWEKMYGGSDEDRVGAALQTSDGGYIVGGRTSSFGFAAWLFKLDSDGSIEWEKTYETASGPSNTIFAIQQTTDGGYVVAGDTHAASGDSFIDFWVAKLDSDGEVEWEKIYADTSDGTEDPNSIKQTSDGGYVVAGRTTGFAFFDAWSIKLDPDGNIEWENAYGGPGFDGVSSIQQTSDGGYVAAGSSSSFVEDLFPHFDVWVLKLDSNGNLGECATDAIQETSAVVEDASSAVSDTEAAVTDTSATVTDTSALVEETSALVRTLCEDAFFHYFLAFLNAEPVDLNQVVGVSASTTDTFVENVIFRWIRPNGDLAREVTVPIGVGEDAFAPDRQGDWIVEADFQNGQVIRKTLTVGFFVLPESPIGALALSGAALVVLGLYIKFRRNSASN
jgi:hypothetical protein